VIDRLDCHIHQSFSCCDKKKEKPTPPIPPTTSGCNISCPISGIIDRDCDEGDTTYILTAQAVPIVVNIENTGTSNAFCTITATLSGPTTSVSITIPPGEKKTLANQSATTLTIICSGGNNNQCRGTYDGCIVIC
jgi:hypothetical protein